MPSISSTSPGRNICSVSLETAGFVETTVSEMVTETMLLMLRAGSSYQKGIG
jgi:hypothetical protein